ncbi:hypothetical protein ACFX13_034562 [Malus domestica]|uniref:LOB domain-containing protein n=1 Tax=Malus domestica TaxID=3750 RepID=A0A498K2D9_MALDO|nr:protein ASYMMETRIC LEAVES 2 [Malus domestica]RXI02339.1 hypothetical protein DVH24_030268 [Malus domestica]
MASSSTNSPCAACKFLRRKCQPECVFAPYFPPDQPHKFANVHKVFGASNVTKLLNELHPHQREDAVNSLAYEADMRLRDPVYGCVGVISLLQHQLRQLQMDLTCAKSELSKYQNLTASHGLIAAAAAAAATATAAAHTHSNNNNNNNDQDHHLHLQSSSLNNLGMGINLISGGGGREHYPNQFFPRDRDHHSYHQQQMMFRSLDGGNNYDASLLAMNAAAGGIYGQLSQQLQQTRAAAGDDRRTIDPS